MIRLENVSLQAGTVPILRDVCLNVARGETLLLVGPSGAGKTSLARLLLGLLDGACQTGKNTRRPQYRWSGRAIVGGTDVLAAGSHELAALRGRKMGLVVQGLSDALNPQLTVRGHIREMLSLHRISGTDPEGLCTAYNIPASLLDRHPAALSGGETRRVLTALAIMPGPECLVLDEPTASLDPENRALARAAIDVGRSSRAQIVISHDPLFFRQMADRIAVLDRGRIVETGRPCDLIANPAHSVTQLLLRKSEKATPAVRVRWPEPPYPDGDPVLRIGSLTHAFGARPVLNNFSLTLHAGACVAVRGVSGAGKSTLARLICGMLPIQSGHVSWSKDASLSGRRGQPRVGYVSQYPHRSLAPHFTVLDAVAEAVWLSVRKADRTLRRRPKNVRSLVGKSLAAVGLPTHEDFLMRRTGTLSGGEAQRLSLARALATRPIVLVADEPTSALDAHSRDEVVGAMLRIKRELGIAIVLFTHDDRVIEALADHTVELGC